MNNWHLRTEILRISHRWYQVILFCVFGGLIGLGLGTIWPAPYRISSDIYVGLNAYRSPYDNYFANVAQQEFRMVDDYKNWQLEQLNAVIISDALLTETLRLLKAENADLPQMSVEELRSQLTVMWRNAGEWHLGVVSEYPAMGQKILQAWKSVIVKDINTAISHSQRVVALDIQMSQISDEMLQMTQKEQRLAYALAELKNCQSDVNETESDRISGQDHWELMGIGTQIASWNPIWIEMLDAAPKNGDPIENYISWAGRVTTVVEQDLAAIPAQLVGLTAQLKIVESQYIEETSQSYGLAATLVVEDIFPETTKIERIRPTGVLMLIGSILGLFAWGGWVSYYLKQSEQK